MRKTKIVCTLGPASADEKVMEAMLRAGDFQIPPGGAHRGRNPR